MNWKLVRDAATSPWKLADAKAGEELDNAKASGVVSIFTYGSFVDVLAADAPVTETVLVKSNLGYTGSDQTRQEMLQNSQFIDARAEFSAKYGSIQWARLAEFPVTRTLISN